MRLVGYVRVSRVAGRQGESFISPDVQRERITAAAAAGRHRVVAWETDLDKTGAKLDRPGLEAALARIERGEADGLAVAKLDRFARSLSGALQTIERLRKAGGELVSAEDNFDTSTPLGRFALQMILALAELELGRIRDGWNAAQGRAVERGVHVASRTPTGYSRRDDGRLEPDAAAAAAVRELFRRRAAGEGWTALAQFMDSTGVTGPYGATTWSTSAIAKMIANPVYLGEARSGSHVNVHAHEPIVTAAEWQAAQGARVAPPPRVGDGLLLSGLVRCSGCRYRVKADTMRDRDGSRLGNYRCRKRHPGGICPEPVSALARVLDPYVEARFLVALGPDGPLAEAAASTQALDEAERNLAALEHELAAYRDETRIAELLGRESFLAGLESRAREVDAARDAVAALRERSALVDTIPARAALIDEWPNLTIAERRKILTAAIDAVIVRPSRGSGRQLPIEERTLILWRGEAPADLPTRGHRVPLAPFPWPTDRPGDLRVAA
jgi:DNA invertase Pin-like site-specific DNA recombinase